MPLVYESLIFSILLYGAENWPVKEPNMEPFEAAHHRWQQRILDMWKDIITNDEIRKKTGQIKLEEIMCQRRL